MAPRLMHYKQEGNECLLVALCSAHGKCYPKVREAFIATYGESWGSIVQRCNLAPNVANGKRIQAILKTFIFETFGFNVKDDFIFGEFTGELKDLKRSNGIGVLTVRFYHSPFNSHAIATDGEFVYDGNLPGPVPLMDYFTRLGVAIAGVWPTQKAEE